MTGRFVSACCEGERCWCGTPAEHKVEETLFDDDPRMRPQEIVPYPGARPFVVQGAHPLVAYVCHAHFRQMMGPAADRTEDGSPVPADNDVLWGAHAIAEALNRDERQVYYMLSKGELPARKVGRLWVSTRRQLRARVNGSEAP